MSSAPVASPSSPPESEGADGGHLPRTADPYRHRLTDTAVRAAGSRGHEEREAEDRERGATRRPAKSRCDERYARACHPGQMGRGSRALGEVRRRSASRAS